MPQPFIGEIRMFGGNFAPAGWNFCDGTVIPMGEYEALFQLIGTTYGGDGETYFNLPDLQSRIPIHEGPGFAIGATGGVESALLNVSEIPAHTHAFEAIATAGDQISPGGNLPAQVFNVTPYINEAPNGSFNGSIQPEGGGQPHDNFQPFLCVNYIIAMDGIFPSPT
jgi:microcystin-dependent protein